MEEKRTDEERGKGLQDDGRTQTPVLGATGGDIIQTFEIIFGYSDSVSHLQREQDRPSLLSPPCFEATSFSIPQAVLFYHRTRWAYGEKNLPDNVKHMAECLKRFVIVARDESPEMDDGTEEEEEGE
ncbi:hypothetical protein NPIL_25241 [Nephila pilipes]|uniref:Uncharacterized protein n=1 Tax=Nephila pilipes TaxID=299642 RepID=A0A8X6QIC8_NEPPI|nr:hypothetical protein NPIL_107641 [Nephila pilipes]GFU20447.1 hypothetical protein NPIL_25241 [Nephila pilipes]